VGRCEAASGSRIACAGCVGTVPPEYREHPPRSDLTRGQRGNPDGVRARLGRPTARKAHSPSGRRKTQQANAGAPKGDRTRKPYSRSFWRWLLGNWPDTGPGVPARKGAHVGRVSRWRARWQRRGNQGTRWTPRLRRGRTDPRTTPWTGMPWTGGGSRATYGGYGSGSSQGLLEPGAGMTRTPGSEGAPAQQCAGATRHRPRLSPWS
jgi:hypothetical protein